MVNSPFINNLKSKVTYERKLIYGVISIIIGFVFWGITHETVGPMDFVLIMIPSILLCIPSDTIKNSRVIGIICTIGLLFMIIVLVSCILDVENMVFDAYYYRYSHHSYSYLIGQAILAYSIQLIYALINIVASLMFFVPTKKNNSLQIPNTTSNVFNTSNENVKFCKYCGAKLSNSEGVAFCSNCGKKIE